MKDNRKKSASRLLSDSDAVNDITPNQGALQRRTNGGPELSPLAHGSPNNSSQQSRRQDNYAQRDSDTNDGDASADFQLLGSARSMVVHQQFVSPKSTDSPASNSTGDTNSRSPVSRHRIIKAISRAISSSDGDKDRRKSQRGVNLEGQGDGEDSSEEGDQEDVTMPIHLKIKRRQRNRNLLAQSRSPSTFGPDARGPSDPDESFNDTMEIGSRRFYGAAGGGVYDGEARDREDEEEEEADFVRALPVIPYIEDEAQAVFNNISAKEAEKKLLHSLTNRFTDNDLEKAYQKDMTRVMFRRSRLFIGILIVVHTAISISFAIFDELTPLSGLRVLGRGLDDPIEWLQWVYLFIAIPYVAWPHNFSPFLAYWKWWLAIIITLFGIGMQLWTTTQSQYSRRDYEASVDMMSSQTCFLNLKNSDYLDTQDNAADFLKIRNANLYTAYVSMAAVLMTVINLTLAVTLRLDFVQVVFTGVISSIALAIILVVSTNTTEPAISIPDTVPAILLSFSTYLSERTSRRLFLSKFTLQRENVELKFNLHKAEEALANDDALPAEEAAVQDVLMGQEAKYLASVRIPFSDLMLLSLIGRGGMGEVIMAEYLGTVVCVKRLRRDLIAPQALVEFRAEIELMSSLRHPNIVQFIGASWDNPSNICMVMEYMENGDVHSVLHSDIKVTWGDPLLKIAIDAAQGMLYLHSNDPPIIHRDLKSVNLLCSTTYGCKVTDFGLSRRLQSDLKTVVGTPFWLAPEVIRNESYSIKADVYSFGIVLYELETRKNPYYEHKKEGKKDGIHLLVAIAHRHLRPTLPESTLPRMRKLIEDCWQDDASQRPTMGEVLMRLQGEIRQEISQESDRFVSERRAVLQRRMRGFGSEVYVRPSSLLSGFDGRSYMEERQTPLETPSSLVKSVRFRC